MKSILLVRKGITLHILDRFYDSICHHLGNCNLHQLKSEEERYLKRYFRDINTSHYDRIILLLRAKYMMKQVGFLKTLPNLCFLEHDAWMNDYHESMYRGKFSRLYRALPWARIISSGYLVSEKLKAEGFDAVFVPKGYDQTMLSNKRLERDIELGFIGTTSHKTYRKRRELLEQLARCENLLVRRTQPGQEYLDILNRIKIFVSADVGFGEYMAKNFEAMACGCVVIAWDQGEKENRVLGFEDMKNIVLYRHKEELVEKLVFLRQNPMVTQQIAQAGQELAESQYSLERLGGMVAEAVKTPLRKKKESRWLGLFRRHSLDQAV